MISESNPGNLLYACVSYGSTILADLISTGIVPVATGGGGGDISALAVTFLEAAPRHHLFYTHTAGRRIHAFLIADRVLFFAIAEDSFGRSAVLHFLHRLRDATVFSAQNRIDSGSPLPHHCLQDELLPIIHRLAVSFPTSSRSDEKHHSSLPPLLISPFLSSATPSSDSHLLTGDHKGKVKKERRKNVRSEEGAGGSRGGSELEILDGDGDGDFGLGSGGRRSLQRVWIQQVRIVLVIDVVVCVLLFGIWLAVCKGFQCLDR